MFIACCRHSGVEVSQTYFEADRAMAAMASTLDCPVVSGDSDFLVNDVDFLPFDLVEWDSVVQDDDDDDDCPYVRCKKFDRLLFLRRHGIEDPKMLPLMSAVLGNDYIPLKTFSLFFCQVKMAKGSKSLGRRQQTICGFLHWLGRESSREGAVDKVMETIPKERREGLRNKLKASLAMYHGESGEVEERPRMLDAGPTVPEWFLQDYLTCRVPSWSLDVVCNRKVYLQCQVEDTGSKCSHLFAEEIMRAALFLLLSMDERNWDSREVKLHAREGTTIKAFKLEISPKPETSLRELRSETPRKRFEFICHTVGLSNEKGDLAWALPCESRLLLCALFWWTLKAETTKVELDSLCFCLAVEQMLGDFRVTECPRLTNENADAVRKRMVRYRALSCVLQGSGRKREANLSFVHRLANLQATLYHLSHLAHLLDLQELSPDVSSFWDGTLLFNVHNDLLTLGSTHANR